MTNRQILTALGPCADGLARAAESPTLREWWEASTTRSDMMWIVGKAHSHGALPRRRIVAVAVRCAETVAHLMPPDALPLLAGVQAWAHGADDVDLDAARGALWQIKRSAYAAAAGAAGAAYAAANAAASGASSAYAAANAAAAYAYAAVAAVAADDAAAYAAAAYAAADADAADGAAAYAALCDVIRDAITIDEVCAALGLDADKGVGDA